MSLVWHIVQKDFRRLAAPLALWALLLVFRGEVGAHVLLGEGLELGRLYYWTIANLVLLWLDAAVCVLLVAALVHEDTLVGPGSTWVTRPISGGRLLTAKLISAVLMFGVLPMVIALRWWLVCGYGGAELARAALALADIQSATVFAALLLAVLTRNVNEFLGWALGLGLALIAWVFVGSVVVKGTEMEVTRGMNETRVVLFLTLVATGGALVIALQYLTRRRGRAVQVALATAAAVLIVSASGWDWSIWWARPPRTSPLARGITITVEHPKIDRRAELDFVLHGVPRDFGVWASADHVFRWNDGALAAARSDWGTGSWPGSAEWHSLRPHAGTNNDMMMQAYAAYGPKRATAPDESVVPMMFLLWADKADRLRTEPATYTGELHVSLRRPALEFELPLRVGAKGEQNGASVRIDHVDWREGQWRVTLVQSRPKWLTYGKNRPSVATLLTSEGDPTTGFVLMNRARGEAIQLAGGRLLQARLYVGLQELEWSTLECGVPRDPAAENSDAPPAWLKDATLAVVRYHEEAVFDRTVKIEKFGTAEELATLKEKP